MGKTRRYEASFPKFAEESGVDGIQPLVLNKKLHIGLEWKMAMQALKVQSSVNPKQNRDRVIERVNAWPEWKRNAFSYRSQGSSTSPTEKVHSDQDDCRCSEKGK